jgi:predicted glycogen debranching enzyme
MADYFLETHHHEWILTNSKGGYALGTGNLVNQRKYHGLLIASDYNFQRRHLVSGMEELVEWRGDSFFLDSNNYSNCIYPEGFLHLVKSWLRPYPIFLYSSLPHNDDILIRKEIMMDLRSNTVMVKYTNLGSHKMHFCLRPKFTLCNHHQINSAGSLQIDDFEHNLLPASRGTHFKTRRISNFIEVYGSISKGEIAQHTVNYLNVFYPWEVMFGYAGEGDQIAFWELQFDLNVNETNYVIFSDEPINDLTTTIRFIQNRYLNLPLPKDYPEKSEDGLLLDKLDYSDGIMFNYDQYMKILKFALSDFLANEDVVAGYPWFGAWGRDTMVTINAFLHSSDMIDYSEQILLKYSQHIRDGRIPNMFPESGLEGNYDSMDATLWYVILLNKLGKYKKNDALWKILISIAEEILKGIQNHKEGLFEIRPDGLISLNHNFAHATWMDVRTNKICVTPRDGAPVEINALWYNAICSYEEMIETHNLKSKKKHKILPGLTEIREKIPVAFQKFWVEDYLADRLIGQEPVLEFRPNALIAVSLPHMLITQKQAQQLFEKAKEELYTPYGIRTLSPRDFKFHKKYYGTQAERDLAYHQGTVWAWLLGPYCGAYLKAYKGVKSNAEIKEELSSIISTFRTSFMKGHISSIAEVWDGEAPHFPKGAPAQAWSVASLYNIESYIQTLE